MLHCAWASPFRAFSLSLAQSNVLVPIVNDHWLVVGPFVSAPKHWSGPLRMSRPDRRRTRSALRDGFILHSPMAGAPTRCNESKSAAALGLQGRCEKSDSRPPVRNQAAGQGVSRVVHNRSRSNSGEHPSCQLRLTFVPRICRSRTAGARPLQGQSRENCAEPWMRFPNASWASRVGHREKRMGACAL